MTDARSERLAADYREMLKIQNRPYVSWIATKGDLPYVSEYLLTVRVRTYAMRAENGRYVVGSIDRCVVRVTLWDSYPQIAPNIKMLSIPPVFHPDWYSRGSYCSSEPWRPDCSLKDHIKRMIGTLTYDPLLMNTAAPANYKALDWYLHHRQDASLFPSDRTELTENSGDEPAAIQADDPFDEIVDSWAIRR